MKIIALMFLAGLQAVVAEAQPSEMRVSGAVVKEEVLAVIQGQLAAFRAGEFERGYGFAAALLRAQIPLERFAQLVRESYPEIWTNTRADFGITQDDGVRATVTARVFAKDGGSARYDYMLVKEGSAWRITGVLRHEAKEATRA